MTCEELCGGCGVRRASEDCRHALAAIGVNKVHWECWSECNLQCPFCYRTRGVPLSTSDALKLINVVHTGGVKRIVFAGGDPSIRPDIGQLVNSAKQIGLGVEIQTNSQYQSPAFLSALGQCDLVGLSLDASDDAVHDVFRRKNGNFKRVVQLLRWSQSAGLPVVMRTVVARSNYHSVKRMSPLVAQFDNIVRWSLLEFSPVGDGYSVQLDYLLDRRIYDEVAQSIRETYTGKAEIDEYRAENKSGTYLLITPDGRVYGTDALLVDGVYPTIGSIIDDHLCDLASKLPFLKEQHHKRYGDAL